MGAVDNIVQQPALTDQNKGLWIPLASKLSVGGVTAAVFGCDQVCSE